MANGKYIRRRRRRKQGRGGDERQGAGGDEEDSIGTAFSCRSPRPQLNPHTHTCSLRHGDPMVTSSSKEDLSRRP